MIVYEKKEYPDNFEDVVNLLQKITTLYKEQVIIYLLQINETIDREDAEQLVDKMIEDGIVEEDEDFIFLPGHYNENEALILAFWLFLSYVKKEMPFERANYPAEIIFKEDDYISEIILCNNNLETKLDYIEKRKKRKCQNRFYFLFENDIVDDFDDDYFPKEEFILVTTAYNNNMPVFFYHDTKVDL